jgi:exodeoxyribonuclease VIII
MSVFDLFCNGVPLPFAPGIYRNMAREVYDRIPALSSTVIKKWIKLQSVPSVFKHWVDHRWEEQPTEALLLGSALDCLRLENGLFASKFITVPPDAPKRPSSVQRNAKKPSPETVGAIAWWNRFPSIRAAASH